MRPETNEPEACPEHASHRHAKADLAAALRAQLEELDRRAKKTRTELEELKKEAGKAAKDNKARTDRNERNAGLARTVFVLF